MSAEPAAPAAPAAAAQGKPAEPKPEPKADGKPAEAKAAESARRPSTVIEANKRLSESPVWKLQRYLGRLGNTCFLLPIGAMHGIRTLRAWSGGRRFLLSGDRAFYAEAAPQRAPARVRHGQRHARAAGGAAGLRPAWKSRAGAAAGPRCVRPPIPSGRALRS